MLEYSHLQTILESIAMYIDIVLDILIQFNYSGSERAKPFYRTSQTRSVSRVHESRMGSPCLLPFQHLQDFENNYASPRSNPPAAAGRSL